MTIENLHEDGESSYFTNSRSGYRFRVAYSDSGSGPYRWSVYRYDVEPNQLWGYFENHGPQLLAYAGNTPGVEPRAVKNKVEALEWITNDRAPDVE